MTESVLYNLVQNAIEAEKDLKPFSMVYVARGWSNPCEFWVKVGRSIDPDKRIETLQKEIDGKKKNVHRFPEGLYDIELLCLVPGGKETERLVRYLLDVEFVSLENKEHACGEYLLLSKPDIEHAECRENLDPLDECFSNYLLHDDLIDFLLEIGFETSQMLKILGVIWHKEKNLLIPQSLLETAKMMERVTS
jgi:hypothetical protein